MFQRYFPCYSSITYWNTENFAFVLASIVRFLNFGKKFTVLILICVINNFIEHIILLFNEEKEKEEDRYTFEWHFSNISPTSFWDGKIKIISFTFFVWDKTYLYYDTVLGSKTFTSCENLTVHLMHS